MIKLLIAQILALCILLGTSLSVYPEINKVKNKTFKLNPTPQPGKPKKVESWFKQPKQKQIQYEMETEPEKYEVAKK